ncbi:MAG: FAD-dependent oxidoreductase [Candidatus Eremiobacteraeota bacterium]|nr:FAD-dependent oxidoreductase [Candidatus Eremiobacteraeota bacterium]MBV8281967.1 FAD-dependent oxidoreductase [Candidatus Eremiobacteraeota bacterium]
MVYEAADAPGGICRSYHMRPGGSVRLTRTAADGDSYRFEIGGGHWIFGDDPALLRFLRDYGSVRRYGRRSAVFLWRARRYIEYPLQDHLEQLESDVARSVAAELASIARQAVESPRTQKEWNSARFGPTLCALFFHPFNERYTAGLYDRIAPQDAYKSPVGSARGYNATFVYPLDGLDVLARRLAQGCCIEYGRRAVAIDPSARTIAFADGTSLQYRTLISTLPLNRMLELTGLHVTTSADPHTASLVLNIGATAGPALPAYHWVYVPDSASGFHRVGIYSNVDRTFLPQRDGHGGRRVALYVERAYPGDAPPHPSELHAYVQAATRELREWGFIDSIEVIDPSWIDIAYTWSWPGSSWRAEATERLQAHGIQQAGRFGRWVYQGIADSIREGLTIGSALSTG